MSLGRSGRSFSNHANDEIQNATAVARRKHGDFNTLVSVSPRQLNEPLASFRSAFNACTY